MPLRRLEVGCPAGWHRRAGRRAAGEELLRRGIDGDGRDVAEAGQQGAQPLGRQVAMGRDGADADGGECRDGLGGGEVGDEDGEGVGWQGGDDGAGLAGGDLVLGRVGAAAVQAEGGGAGGVGGQDLGGGLEGAAFEEHRACLTMPHDGTAQSRSGECGPGPWR